MLNSFLRLSSQELAIDLGTAVSKVYVKGKGIALMEPSVVAVTRNPRGDTRVVAFGEEAKRMVGRVPHEIEVIRPLRDGVIAEFEPTELMLRHFIAKVHKRRSLVKSRMILSVPTGITMIEKKTLQEAAEASRASEVFFILEPIAAAIGAGLPVTEPTCSMIVDIGGGTTQVGVISLAGIVSGTSIRQGGIRMDQVIVQHVKEKHRLLIGEGTAEMVKLEIGSAYPMDNETAIEVKGRDMVSGIPRSAIVNSDEVRGALGSVVVSIVETVKSALDKMPPELAADIIGRGIVLTGGGALLKNLDVLLMEETHLPVIIADNPIISVALGAGRALDDPYLFKQIRIERIME
jgi:rod shape-determining protein MreB